MSFENKIIFLSAVTLFISLLDVNIMMVSYPILASTSILIIFIPTQRRGRAFGIGATFGAIGLSIGATVGGVLTGYIGEYIISYFYINIKEEN